MSVRRDQAAHRGGRHLPERGRDHPPGGCHPPRAERCVWTALALQGVFGSAGEAPALAVVYPASESGTTAAGLDGLRGSTAGQMDELAARIVLGLKSIPVRPVPPSACLHPCNSRSRTGSLPATPPYRWDCVPDRCMACSGAQAARGGFYARAAVPRQIPRPPPDQLEQPWPRQRRSPSECADQGACSVDQQGPQVAVAGLGDLAQLLPAAAGGDPWRQAEPSREATRRIELARVTDRRY